MVRTQLSLTEAQKHMLDVRAAETGLSLSELVRQAVERCYRAERDTDADIEDIRQAVGAWRAHDIDGEQYVEGLRPGRRPEQ